MIGIRGAKYNSPCLHGHGVVGVFKLQARIVGLSLLIEIVDDAPPSDPALWSSAASAAQRGGHGLRMIGELADEAEFFAMPDENRAMIKFCLMGQLRDD
jgi:hypothetical protein